MIFCAVRFWVIIDVLESVADEETKEKEDETEDKVEETKPEAEPDPEPKVVEEGMLLLFPTGLLIAKCHKVNQYLNKFWWILELIFGLSRFQLL